MSFRKLVAIFLLLIGTSLVFATERGIETSNYLYNYLKKEKLSPKSQLLVTSGINSFPYNITFDIKREASSDCNKLILVFDQNDIIDHKDLLPQLIDSLKNLQPKNDISILFSYGDKTVFPEYPSVHGSKVYLDNQILKQNSIVVFFDINSRTNDIISNGKGITSPSFLIQKVYNTACKSKIKFSLPFFYLSQVYSYNLSIDSLLDDYLNQSIPSIKITLDSNNIESSELFSFITTIAENLSQVEEIDFDQHFLITKINPKYYLRISEHFIVVIIISIIITFLLFLSLFFFINNRIQKEAWKQIRKIWFIIPLFFAITYISLISGKYFSLLLTKASPVFEKMIFTANIQFIFSFAAITAVSTLILLFYNDFSGRSIDYLLIFCTFINQFIFLYLDISFFPIFMFICFISIFSQIFKNKHAKIVFLILFISPLYIYTESLITSILKIDSFSFVWFSNTALIFLSLTFYPIYLLFFRTSEVFYKSVKSQKKLIIFNAIFCLSICVLSLIFSICFTKVTRKKYAEIPRIINEIPDSDDFSLVKTDKKVFDNLIRTLTIKLPVNTILCQVELESEENSPILYSDNSYLNISKTKSQFIIPENPPEELTFSYGVTKGKSVVNILLFIKTDKNEFNRVTKSYIIE